MIYLDPIDKLGFIWIENKKVLGVLSRGQNRWYIPGGKREKGETDKEALIREIKEELSVDLVPGSIRYYGTFKAQAHGKPDGYLVRIISYTAGFRGKLKPSSEIERLAFFSYRQKSKLSAVGELIIEDLKSKGLVD